MFDKYKWDKRLVVHYRDNSEQHQKIQKYINDFFKKHSIVRGRAVFICQNPTFDRIFLSHLLPVYLQEELSLPYSWLDLASMVWAKDLLRNIPISQIALSKDKIAAAYNIPPEPLPHRANRGVIHLLACYRAVIGFPSQPHSNAQR